MSWEAWGDDDDAGSHDHLLDAGWWASEQVAEVQTAIKALRTEPVYEDGKKDNGISVRFLARITALEAAAGLDVPGELLAEAQRMLTDPPDA